MKILDKLYKLYKRFRGYPEFLHKEQCSARIKCGDSYYYCTKNVGHIGPHTTYDGKRFFSVDLTCEKSLNFLDKNL